jgi:hypothetical protein
MNIRNTVFGGLGILLLATLSGLTAQANPNWWESSVLDQVFSSKDRAQKKMKEDFLAGKTTVDIDDSHTGLRLLTLNEKVAGADQPRVYVFVLIDAEPIEAAAIFSDISKHKDFMPRVLRSDSRNIGHQTFVATYEVHVGFGGIPFIKDPVDSTHYSLTDVVSASPRIMDSNKGFDKFKVSWKMIKAEHSTDIDGYAIFEPYGSRTLMTYVNYSPPTENWGIVRSGIRDGIIVAADQIRERIESVNKYPGWMQSEVSCFRRLMNDLSEIDFMAMKPDAKTYGHDARCGWLN